MKTKEEIFNSHSWQELGAISPSKSFCLKAMDEYAKEVALEFGIWVSTQNLFCGMAPNGIRYWHSMFGTEKYTTEQLFDKFKQENNL